MPELPEVETIKNTVKNAFDGAIILRAEVYQPKLRHLMDRDFAAKISGARIEKTERIAKYMLMKLSNGLTIIWHFGMSGKIRIESTRPTILQKHDHVVIETDKGILIYNDTRRFGLVDICPTENLAKNPNLSVLGLDPWDANLDKTYVLKKFKNKKVAVKLALLDQSIICGIGNIYASEILYRALILPQRACESVTADEAERIVKFTREVLSESIAAGGSTIHDYKRPDGDIGYFQEKHCVYNKEGKRCPNCTCRLEKTGGIQKIVQGGRSTFYCPVRQK